MRISNLLILLLVFFLPFIHGKILGSFGLDIYVDIAGNFEFSKSLFLSFFAPLILLIFTLESIFLRERFRNFSLLEILFLGVIGVSTLVSISPFTSLIGDTDKGHTSLLFFHLFGLYYVLSHKAKNFYHTCIQVLCFSLVGVSLLALKELFFSSFDYGQLSLRALGSFGHPNYLSGFLLIGLPLSFYIKNIFLKYIFLSITEVTIILSGSIVGAFVLIGVLCLWNPSINKILSSYSVFTKSCVLAGVLCLSVIFLVLYFPEKLHSFLSRFYLWKTTFLISTSSVQQVIFGSGLETLPYFFNSFKVPELYIYENFGYTADRPHNFVMNILYHTGLLGLGVFLYSLKVFSTKYKKISSPLKYSLIIFLVYGVFHYFSVSSYLLLVFILAYISSKKSFLYSKLGVYIALIMTIFSLIGGYFQSQLLLGELRADQGEYYSANQIFSHPSYLIEFGEYQKAEIMQGILTQENIKKQIINAPNKQILCEKLTEIYPSVENYFYCGSVFTQLGKTDLEELYYVEGLKKLPNLWDEDSLYWDNYFIKNTITGNRFFSPRFSNLKQILEKYENAL